MHTVVDNVRYHTKYWQSQMNRKNLVYTINHLVLTPKVVPSIYANCEHKYPWSKTTGRREKQMLATPECDVSKNAKTL